MYQSDLDVLPPEGSYLRLMIRKQTDCGQAPPVQRWLEFEPGTVAACARALHYGWMDRFARHSSFGYLPDVDN